MCSAKYMWSIRLFLLLTFPLFIGSILNFARSADFLVPDVLGRGWSRQSSKMKVTWTVTNGPFKKLGPSNQHQQTGTNIGARFSSWKISTGPLSITSPPQKITQFLLDVFFPHLPLIPKNCVRLSPFSAWNNSVWAPSTCGGDDEDLRDFHLITIGYSWGYNFW